jgi:glucose-6-phosphate dehydrogenase assembly protein OpcA
MSEALPSEAILKELANLWVSQGKDAQTEEGAGVLRACTMTLVVLGEESEDLSSLGETIAALMPEHPARAIVIRLGCASSAPLEQRVYAQCWKPFGQRRQICCEQIEIKASDEALSGLPWVVLPLAVADLPVMVWCRSPRLFAMAEFSAIAGMASKIIVDTSGMGDNGLKMLSALIDAGRLVGDLAWTRLTRWREMLAQVFENRDNLAHIRRIKRIMVNFADQAPVVNWYMAAWTSNALSDAGISAELAVGAAAGTNGAALVMDGEDVHVEMGRNEDRMTIAVNGLMHCASLPRPTEYLLMREELAIVRRDAIFERTVASASRLAYANGR